MAKGNSTPVDDYVDVLDYVIGLVGEGWAGEGNGKEGMERGENAQRVGRKLASISSKDHIGS